MKTIWFSSLISALSIPGMLFAGTASAAVGDIGTLAGTGTAGFSGDGGPATSAQLNAPLGVVTDSAGNTYIADMGNNRIRKVDSSGTITTVAGNGAWDYSGDGGPATSASLKSPYGVAIDPAGNIYIADSRNNRIRKVNTSGIITTVAGDGTVGYAGDGGPATSAKIWAPYGLAVDSVGNIYIADTGNSVIRKVDTSGVITSLTSPGVYGIPYGVAMDSSGNVFFTDAWNTNKVYKIATSGSVSTVAGNATAGYSGDGGPATSASLSLPTGVAVDTAGNVYIADNGNNRIRRVDTSGIISTVAGNGTAGYSGDGGPATSASLKGPFGVATGSLLIAQTDNNVVSKVVTDSLAGGAPDIELECHDQWSNRRDCRGQLIVSYRDDPWLNLIKVANRGTAKLEISGLNLSGMDSAGFSVSYDDWVQSVGACRAGTILDPNVACYFKIQSPATGTLKTAVLCVTSNDPDESPTCLDVWAGGTPTATQLVSLNSKITKITALNAENFATSGFKPKEAFSFDAIDLVGVKFGFAIFVTKMPEYAVINKILPNGSPCQIYPEAQCSGVTDAALSGDVFLFKVDDNSLSDGDLASGAISDPIVIGSKASLPVALAAGWNLVGNSSSTTLDIAATFGDPNKVTTVWKWIPAQAKWAFYTPALGDGGAAYAAGKDYDFLSSVAGGNGFWVNAKVPFTAQFPAGTSISSASFQSMSSGWNLIAVHGMPTPSGFNKALSTMPPAPGDVPLNLTTLWAWDATQNNWYFYAPSLEKNGTLSSYLSSKGYLDFGTRVLDPTAGFWVNKP